MKKIIIIIISSFILISASFFFPTKKLKKDVLYYYSKNLGLSKVENEIFYAGQRIDSIVNVWGMKDSVILRYKYNLNQCDVFVYQSKFDTLEKYFHFEKDSLDRLTKFIFFSENKIINEDKYFFDKDSKLIKKFSTHGYFWIDSVNYSEHQYFMKGNNIDSVYNYYFDKDSLKILASVSIYKYDDAINPFKNLLYDHIGDRYFNTNNITKKYFRNTEDNVITDSILYDYIYDSENYLFKDMSNHTPWETDSSINVYHYE